MIETKRLNIRLITINDLDDIYEYTSDPYTMRYERSEFKSKDQLAKMLQYFIDNKGAYAVLEKGKNKVIGQLVLIPTIPKSNNEYNLGYVFHEDYQGKGYCTESSKALLDFAFNTLNIHRIKASCNPENIGSWKVMEKIGMKKEAEFKEKVCFRSDQYGNPIYTNEYVYGINQNDYIKYSSQQGFDYDTKLIVDNFFKEVYNNRNFDYVHKFYSRDYFEHREDGARTNLEAIEIVKSAFSVFPDLSCTVLDTICDRSICFTHVLFKGTHKGEFFGILPTDKYVEFEAMEKFKVIDGVITESWGSWPIHDILDDLKK